MHKYIHVYIHTLYTYMYIQTYIHTLYKYIHTYLHTYTYIHTYIHTYCRHFRIKIIIKTHHTPFFLDEFVDLSHPWRSDGKRHTVIACLPTDRNQTCFLLEKTAWPFCTTVKINLTLKSRRWGVKRRNFKKKRTLLNAWLYTARSYS